MPYLDTSYIQQTNIGAYVYGLDGSYYTQRYVRWSYRLPSGSYTVAGYSDQIVIGATSSPVFNIGGLSPGTTYVIKGEVLNYWNDAWLWEDTMSVTTQGTPQPIPNPYSWSWNATEQDALYHKGKTTAITWQRWNEFCEQVRLTSCWFLGYTSSSDPYNCNSAKMNSGSKILTASRFLTIKRAIGSMKSTDYDGKFPDSLIVTGRAVFGWYFIRLSEVYNGITKLQTYDMPLGAMKDLHNIELLHVEAKLEDLNRERVRQDVHY